MWYLQKEQGVVGLQRADLEARERLRSRRTGTNLAHIGPCNAFGLMLWLFPVTRIVFAKLDGQLPLLPPRLPGH